MQGGVVAAFYRKYKSGVQTRIIAQKGDKRRRIYKFFMKMAFPDVEKLFLMETKSETVLFIKGSSVVLFYKLLNESLWYY